MRSDQIVIMLGAIAVVAGAAALAADRLHRRAVTELDRLWCQPLHHCTMAGLAAKADDRHALVIEIFAKAHPDLGETGDALATVTICVVKAR